MILLDKVVFLEEEASNFGFSWENTAQIMQQIRSECLEIEEHLSDGLERADSINLQEEIGDLMHAVFSLCVFCKFNPQQTLAQTLDKFERRLNAVQSIAHEQGLEHLEGHSFDELMNIWDKAKERVG